MARRLKHLRTSRCPCRGRLGTLKTPSCPWRWVPGSRSKFGNWTTVPSRYSWNIAECDVKPQQSYKPNQNCFSLGTFDFSQLFWWALCRLCHYVPFETAWITAYYFSDVLAKATCCISTYPSGRYGTSRKPLRRWGGGNASELSNSCPSTNRQSGTCHLYKINVALLYLYQN